MKQFTAVKCRKHVHKRCNHFLGSNYPLLVSYFYLRRDKGWYKEILSRPNRAQNVYLDSGGYSFCNSARGLTSGAIMVYYTKYIECVSMLGVETFFELDLFDMSYEDRLKLREYAYTKIGRVPVMVWHIEDGEEMFEDMLRLPHTKMIGIPMRDFGSDPRLLEPYVKRAKDRGIKIHALGFMPRELRKGITYPYSCDSSNINNLFAFGKVWSFKNEEFKEMTPPKGKRLKAEMVDKVIDNGLKGYKIWLEKVRTL